VVKLARSMTHAGGAAIALCDQSGVICRASTGDAPETFRHLALVLRREEEKLPSGSQINKD